MPYNVPKLRSAVGIVRSAILPIALAGGLLSVPMGAAFAAGSWVLGSSFDPATTLATYFARFVADRGEGQMTVRCDGANGISIDTGVTGNGEAPEGVEIGGNAEATVRLVAADGSGAEPLTAEGPVMIRADGAVMLALIGEGAAAIGVALLQPADHAEVTIGDVTANVPLTGASELFASVAKSCPAWPK